MRKGRPEASPAVVIEQQRVIHTPGPVGRVISCRGLASEFRGTTVHTARSSPLIKNVGCLLATHIFGKGVTQVLRQRQSKTQSKNKKEFAQTRVDENEILFSETIER